MVFGHEKGKTKNMPKSPEQYQPSAEEIKKAEEMMYPMQKEVSETRENIMEKWEKEGKVGYLKLEREFEPNNHNESNYILSGSVGEHKIKIEFSLEPAFAYLHLFLKGDTVAGRIKGSIDGIEIKDEKKLETIVKKYGGLAYYREYEGSKKDYGTKLKTAANEPRVSRENEEYRVRKEAEKKQKEDAEQKEKEKIEMILKELL